MIERSHTQISIRRQCTLLGLNRSSLYCPPAQETEENLWLMRLIRQPVAFSVELSERTGGG